MRRPIGFGAVMVLLLAGAAFADGIPARPSGQIDVNRPHSPFDCTTPIGENWYGSTRRCLAELCAGHNVYNEYIFEGIRRRKNPCYGQSPTDYPSDE